MDKTTMEQIFDPFFTTKEPGQGTGLGLATVYGIVKQHGGYIAVDSHPGQGATFDIYFPVTRNVRTDKESKIPETIPGGKETILIADDNDAVREFIKEVLELSGYRTIEATDGDDAVKKYGEVVPIDLVILDTVMPKMNGREAFEEMRKTNPSVQSLFISGYSNDILLNKGVRDKEFHFLSKPLFPEALLKKVRDIIDGETADRL
jgi:CheY-like chemotaxis protein